MGDFRITIEAVGGHGCDRDKKDLDQVYGCGRNDCPDCMTREFILHMKHKGVNIKKAILEHWPADLKNEDGTLAGYTKEGQVTDNLLTGIRRGSFSG